MEKKTKSQEKNQKITKKKNDDNYKQELLVAISAAKKAGLVLKKNYGKPLTLSYKEQNDFVTNIDLACEKIIIQELKKAFPKYNLFSEETGKETKNTEKDSHTWIIDPLDGTTNFMIQNPFFNVTIGLARDKRMVLGVVYNPLQNELFWATEHSGAFCNNQKISVKEKESLGKSVLGFCHGSKSPNAIQRGIGYYSKIKPHANHLRQFGSAALELCYVASGRIQGFYMSDINAYDVGAGALIAHQAGAIVTDFSGNEFTLAANDILAAAPKQHQELLTLLKNTTKP